MTNRLSMTMITRLKVWQCKLWFLVWMIRRTEKEVKDIRMQAEKEETQIREKAETEIQEIQENFKKYYE